MEWKEVEEFLIKNIGLDYENYPMCVEWNIRVLIWYKKWNNK